MPPALPGSRPGPAPPPRRVQLPGVWVLQGGGGGGCHHVPHPTHGTAGTARDAAAWDPPRASSGLVFLPAPAAGRWLRAASSRRAAQRHRGAPGGFWGGSAAVGPGQGLEQQHGAGRWDGAEMGAGLGRWEQGEGNGTVSRSGGQEKDRDGGRGSRSRLRVVGGCPPPPQVPAPGCPRCHFPGWGPQGHRGGGTGGRSQGVPPAPLPSQAADKAAAWLGLGFFNLF